MKMRKITMVVWGLALTLAASVQAHAQTEKAVTLEGLEQQVEALEKESKKQSRLKVSGYVQVQYQNGQRDASLKVGEKSNDSGDGSYNRFGIRRGRIKFAYDGGVASGVFQLDVTENGVKFKDAYLNLRDPWVNAFSLRAGIFDRPFGYEISYSSSRRESPERSTVFQTLFPDERDLGAMLVVQAPADSPWSILKLEAGLFAGNGIKPDTDSRKDFIGHLSLGRSIGDNFSFGIGASYYNGKVFQGSTKVFEMEGGGWREDDRESNKGGYARREYGGFDAQLSFRSAAGLTQLRGEYLFGRQPGTESSSKSPNSDKRPDGPTYIRRFNGYYAMLVQSLGKLPVSAVVKYDRYDPNTKVSGDGVGQNGTGKADIAMGTLGFGAFWDIDKSLRLTAYYDMVRNEKSDNLEGFANDRKDNVFTLRLQYKF